MERSQHVRHLVKTVVGSRGHDRALADDAALIEDGLIDSLSVVELVTLIEQDFGILVEDEDLLLENLGTIAAIVEFVARKSAAR